MREVLIVSVTALAIIATGLVIALIVKLLKDHKASSKPNNTSANNTGTNNTGGSTNNTGTNNTGGSNIPPSNVNSQAWLGAHNKYRSKAGYPPLKWSSALAAQSAQFASNLINSGTFHHGDYNNPEVCKNSGGNCGQNLEEVTGADAGVIAVDHWYGECPKYNGTFSEASGHYSQVMWKDAQLVGCGVANTGGTGVAACLYDRGNVIGEFADNVPKPGVCYN